MHEHKIEIQRDQQLVFKSNRGSTVRSDDLSQLENMERQLTGTIHDLQHQLEVQRQQEAARLEAIRLETQRKLAQTREIESQQRGHGHGFAR
ncbi:MAG: hypothetical protein JO235_21700 [Chroococcidiopsidaceae cyanobacterium CP_BM_RX_35]|nr:hypothetical protein [Chroococcidiopsidaceae cyanobacterium CP_BM_RX_35]